MPTPSQIRTANPATTPLDGTEILHAEQSASSVGVTVDEIAERTRVYLPIEIAMFVAGKPLDSELLFRYKTSRAFRIPASATGSLAEAAVASAASVVFSLQKNGVGFGTVTFATSATGAYTVAANTDFVVGDVLSLVAPVTADTALSDIGFTLKGVAQ